MANGKGTRLAAGAALLAVCGSIAANAVTATDWRARMTDTENQLAYSRQRERKQQVELEQVQEALPQVQATLDELLPMRDVAASEEAELRAARKEARATDKALTEAVTASQLAADEARDALLSAVSEETGLLNDAGALWLAFQRQTPEGRVQQDLTARAQEVRHGQ